MWVALVLPDVPFRSHRRPWATKAFRRRLGMQPQGLSLAPLHRRNPRAGSGERMASLGSVVDAQAHIYSFTVAGMTYVRDGGAQWYRMTSRNWEGD